MSSFSFHLFTGLTGFAADLLAGVLHALAEVGFGRSLGADDGSDLADGLLVDALDDNRGVIGDLEADPVFLFKVDGVGVAEVERQLLAGLLCLIADADDLDSLHHHKRLLSN